MLTLTMLKQSKYISIHRNEYIMIRANTECNGHLTHYLKTMVTFIEQPIVLKDLAKTQYKYIGILLLIQAIKS